ncbi:hypothetical protein NQZ68_011391, partial [Dissostichus eleginoides]
MDSGLEGLRWAQMGGWLAPTQAAPDQDKEKKSITPVLGYYTSHYFSHCVDVQATDPLNKDM